MLGIVLSSSSVSKWDARSESRCGQRGHVLGFDLLDEDEDRDEEEGGDEKGE